MKILQINGWTGRIKDGLSRFIAEGEYDVVCMQEAIWSDDCNEFLELYVDTVDKIQREAGYENVSKASNYGTKILRNNAQFEIGNVILSKIPFASVEERNILGQYTVVTDISNYKNTKDHSYTAQKAVLSNGIAVVNYHGYWQKDPIGNETTIQCMQRVAKFIKEDFRPTVMCGDLNIVCESPAMHELDFMQELIQINQIKTTLRNIRFIKDVACDHILITNDLRAEHFTTINAPISDHMALTVDISH